MPRGRRLWTNEERRRLVILWWSEDDMNEVAKKLNRSEAACWIEFARIALYGIELAEFRDKIKKLEQRLDKIDDLRGPKVKRILKEYEIKQKP
jgi:hypothetical protein